MLEASIIILAVVLVVCTVLLCGTIRSATDDIIEIGEDFGEMVEEALDGLIEAVRDGGGDLTEALTSRAEPT